MPRKLKPLHPVYRHLIGLAKFCGASLDDLRKMTHLPDKRLLRIKARQPYPDETDMTRRELEHMLYCESQYHVWGGRAGAVIGKRPARLGRKAVRKATREYLDRVPRASAVEAEVRRTGITI